MTDDRVTVGEWALLVGLWLAGLLVIAVIATAGIAFVVAVWTLVLA